MVALSPRVSRLRAPNPGLMTLDGTNSYVVDGGDGAWLAIDPGPPIDAHVERLAEAARERGAHYAAILVTHGHPDHFPAAAPLARATGAPVLAHPAATFAHDRALGDGETLAVGDAHLTALHAPGHAPDHLVFVLDDERALFTGDVILGTGTVLIAPPNGDMRAYQRTLHRLRDDFGDARAIYGGHGPEIRNPRERIEAYIAHREEREAAIVHALRAEPQTIPEMVAAIYRDVERRMWPAAARQVLAYLVALEREGRVISSPAEREPTAEERTILTAPFRSIADPASAAVARAELGDDAPPSLRVYALAA